MLAPVSASSETAYVPASPSQTNIDSHISAAIPSDHATTNDENINGDACVGAQSDNEENGAYECIPDCDESNKPLLGQRFSTLDEGVGYYKEYAAFVGFDVRSSTIKRNRYGDVEVKYLLCSREGYTVTKEQSRVGILCRHVFVVLKDDDAEMIPPKYIVQRWTKKGNAKEIDAHTEDKDESKILGKVWNEFNNYMALAKGNIKDVHEILNFMQEKKGGMMKRHGMIEAKRKNSDLVDTFYGTGTTTTITIKPPPISKNKGSGKRLKSAREKASDMKKNDGRKCNGCGQKPARHDFRNCLMNPKNQQKENKNDNA
nr:protein FAR1-RELATED SEQUENCE 5-like [Ipomoea batatas]